MYYIYILKSSLKKFYYTGCTDNLKKRLNEHNKGLVLSTKSYKPFTLIYYEACLTKKDAYNREKYLKSRLGKRYINNRLKYYFRA